MSVIVSECIIESHITIIYMRNNNRVLEKKTKKNMYILAFKSPVKNIKGTKNLKLLQKISETK